MLQFSSLAGRAMEAVNHSKNMAVETDTISKTRGKFENSFSKRNQKLKQFAVLSILVLSLILVCCSCGSSKQVPRPKTKTITLNSEPSGARVIANGRVVCNSTPCTIEVPLTYHIAYANINGGTHEQKTAENNQTKFIF